MRRYLGWSAPLALMGLWGCGSEAELTATGTLAMDLRTEAAGVAYRLGGAVFDVAGPEAATLDSDDDPDAASIQRLLDAGDYSIHLRDGWRLERQLAPTSVFEAVAAELASSNPVAFSIVTAQTTDVVYTFETDGQALEFGEGNLDLSIEVRVSPVCAVGEVRCDGSLLQRCADDGSGFDTVELCATPALCQAGAGGLAICLAQTCSPGEARCNGPQGIERCNAALTGFEQQILCNPESVCTELGSNAVCVPTQVCVPGEARCSGDTLQFCANDGSGFLISVVCSSGAQCDAASGACLP